MEILEVILKLVLAIALGGLIGLEREASQKPAGFRTNILVCVASAMMMTLAPLLVPPLPTPPLLLFHKIEHPSPRKSQFHYHMKAKARPYILSSLRKLALHHGVRLDRLGTKQEGAAPLPAFSLS